MVLALSLALPAAAATGPWSWEDISAKIPIKRDNWRVMAVGHFGNDWYFTNSKAFANGGKVWKLWQEGKVTEVTGSLKNAGLVRVDGIVSHATSINYVQINDDSSIKSASWNGSAVSEASDFEDNEMVGADEQLWQGMEQMMLIVGNKDKGMVVGNTEAGKPASVFRYVSNGQVRDLSTELAVVPTGDWTDALAAWNGASWMIIVNHDLVRFDGEKLTYLGHTRDKFSSITAMQDGTFLLGGATTDNIPMAKLVRVTEALPMMTEEPASTSTINEAPPLPPAETGPVVTTFLWSVKPMTMVNNKRMLTAAADGSYGVTATNRAGVKKLELLVNGTVKNTCEATGKTQIYCRIYLKAADYAGTAKLDVMARATDINDVVAEGANETFWTQ